MAWGLLSRPLQLFQNVLMLPARNPPLLAGREAGFECTVRARIGPIAPSDVCRKHGISSATFYKWKAKYGGLEVSDARRLKTLEDENAKLKKLLAEAMLDNAMLKDVASKKW
jgi:putative transposase